MITLLLAALLLTGCAASAPAATAPVTEPTTPVTEATVPVTETAVPETTAAPTQAPTAPATPPVITKNPTGETLTPGGKTWFIAHADGATILTWEFVSPNGVVYSVTETMSQHPGLELDISQADTVAVSNVPLSLNGWSVQARFDGPGGSVTSQAALITVQQGQGAYDAVIEKYRTAMAHKDEGDSVPYQYDVSEMMLYAANVGYALQDLDGDGVQELLIAGIGYYTLENTLFEIYTLQNGAPVRVAQSSVRCRYYLMNDNRIYCEGSSGAAYSNFSVMQYSAGTIRFLNGLYTTDVLADGTPSPYTYYYTTSNQFGDLSLLPGDNGMEEKAANTFLKSWQDAITLPNLCLIA